MKKVLASDNALKVISFITAIIIWIYISFIVDPKIEITVRDVPIQFIGQEELERKGLAIISESASSLTLTLSGSRKTMGKYDMDSISANVNVANAQKGSNTIIVEATAPIEHQEITSQSIYTVDVIVENISEKVLPIEASTTGSLAKDYMSGDIKVSPETVTVKGPESAVARVMKAGVKLDLNDADVDIDIALPISYYDEKNKMLAASDAIMKRIKASSDTALVHCPVLKLREISPTAYFGWQELPENFSYSIEPSKLYIYGEETGSTKIDTIETAEIPLDKLIENEKVKVKLNIPENVKILYDITEVEVSVTKD